MSFALAYVHACVGMIRSAEVGRDLPPAGMDSVAVVPKHFFCNTVDFSGVPPSAQQGSLKQNLVS